MKTVVLLSLALALTACAPFTFSITTQQQSSDSYSRTSREEIDESFKTTRSPEITVRNLGR